MTGCLCARLLGRASLALAGSVALMLALPAGAAGQINVHPTGVNVNTQGATTVFLTFGGLSGYEPLEGVWCGALVPAAPDIGFRCDPNTIFGRLPLRLDRSRSSATDGFTDIMSIPPSVSRRAYQAAAAGQPSSFYYVRRFRNPGGGPDQYVPVTCRLAGGGARVPFALTDVRIHFDVETPILYVQPGEPLPPLQAEISYNGSGTLQGRWEVVLPGEELPTATDLLTEATLPEEERAMQRRYRQIERFHHFLPPTGRFVLRGPDPSRLPTDVEGVYLILLRVEATADKEGDSSLDAAGAGSGLVHTGGVAGFPLPALRYVIGSGGSELATVRSARGITMLRPASDAALAVGSTIEFSWLELVRGDFYRVDLETEDGIQLHSAIVPSGLGIYRAPPWLSEASSDVRRLRWRVSALDVSGRQLAASDWRPIRVTDLTTDHVEESVSAPSPEPPASPAEPPL
jgi:hypothetical protein